MDIPKYPENFDECGRSKRITVDQLDKKINDEIETMIDYMKKHNTENYSKAFEDVLIMIDRIHEDDQTYYEISVAKQHSRAIVR
ncbi:hypothetical protein BTR23_24825 [Alkalihalophilus pseudofirmus]|uniref:hypothetical protein n=1 Tax=Alkalihalobacterium alkalinitrilicum TaxID=427920 RepID=UPI00094C52A2|nr:hypothetical protein [Alkalihalobacterium alkalinitrilicum]OLO25367.1 hypothetical protein BTR23_24825 [Alkalihalophilus pseudofirmus]